MKNVKLIIFILLMIISVIPNNIFAIGRIDIDTSNIEITKGEKKSFNIKLDNAAGRINITSSNKDSVNIDSESIFLDNNSININVDGIKAGTSIITIYTYDVTTYDNESLTGKTYQITVNVIDNNYLKGDIDGNNKIDLSDVISVLKKYIGLLPINNDDLLTCDMDKNGQVNLNDVIILLKTYLGIDE